MARSRSGGVGAPPRLGFTRAIVPRSRTRLDDGLAGVDLVVVGSLAEALRAALADPVTAVPERV